MTIVCFQLQSAPFIFTRVVSVKSGLSLRDSYSNVHHIYYGRLFMICCQADNKLRSRLQQQPSSNAKIFVSTELFERYYSIDRYNREIVERDYYIYGRAFEIIIVNSNIRTSWLL